MPTQNAIAFFHANAGFSYNPKTQTEEEGKTECAIALANAEEAGRDAGLSFAWSLDTDSDSRDFAKGKRYDLWQCAGMDESGECVASLHAIDFGRDGDPHASTYRRVVEAELASEAIANSSKVSAA